MPSSTATPPRTRYVPITGLPPSMHYLYVTSTHLYTWVKRETKCFNGGFLVLIGTEAVMMQIRLHV